MPRSKAKGSKRQRAMPMPATLRRDEAIRLVPVRIRICRASAKERETMTDRPTKDEMERLASLCEVAFTEADRIPPPWWASLGRESAEMVPKLLTEIGTLIAERDAALASLALNQRAHDASVNKAIEIHGASPIFEEALRLERDRVRRLVLLATKLGATEGQLTEVHGDRLAVREIQDAAATPQPVLGRVYVCRYSSPPGWGGERVRVLGVSLEQRTAKVTEITTDDATAYETVVSWDDLVPDPLDARTP